MRNIDTMTREQLILLVERLDQENWTLRNKVKCLESDIRGFRNKTNATPYKTCVETNRKFRIDKFGNVIPEPLNNII